MHTPNGGDGVAFHRLGNDWSGFGVAKSQETVPLQ